MRFRIISLTIFVIAIIGAFIYFQWDGNKPVSAVQNEQSEAELSEQRQQDYEDWWSEGGEVLRSRPTYHKPISVVHIGELNTDVLLGQRFGHVVESDIVLDTDNKTIDFGNLEQVPGENDNMLVIRDAYNMEVLLEEQLYRSSGDEVQVVLHPLNEPDDIDGAEYAFIHEARLFEGQAMTIRQVDEAGTIEIITEDKQRKIAPGKTAVFEASKELQGLTVRSKIVVTNYGLWDTSDMTYIVQE